MRLLGANVVVEPLLRLRLFGVVEGWSCTGVDVWPRGRKAQAILAYLALAAEDAVPRGRLIGLLWSPRWEEQARASLRQSLMELRRAVGLFDGRLVTIERNRVSLDRRFVWVDGLSIHASDPAFAPRLQPSVEPNRLLESLTGVDPKFDAWIDTARRQLADELAQGPRYQAMSHPAGEPNHGRIAIEVPVSAGVSRSVDKAAPCPSLPPVPAGPPDTTADPRAMGVSDRDASNHGLSASSAGTASMPAAATAPSSVHLPHESVSGTARRLAISVMPFIAIGRLDQDDYLPAALTQESVSALAKFRWLLVRLGHRGETEPCSYQLEGFVRRASSGYRISVRLVDPHAGGAVIWTHDEDTALEVLEAALRNVAERIIGQVDPHILAIETHKASRKLTQQCGAYECVLRATPLLYRFEVTAWHEALSLLGQAIARDPYYGRAYAFSALARVNGLAQGWTRISQIELQTIAAQAARAVECDPYDSMALAICAHICVFTQHSFERALTLFDTALRQNPNCGYSWAYSAVTFAYLGRIAEATTRLARARELLVYDPFGTFLEGFASVVAYFSGDWARTIELCSRQLIVRPSFTNNRKILIGALAHAGRHAEARRQHDQLKELEPGFDWPTHLESYPFGREADRVALAAALTCAGLLGPEPQAPSTHAEIIALGRPTMSKRRMP